MTTVYSTVSCIIYLEFALLRTDSINELIQDCPKSGNVEQFLETGLLFQSEQHQCKFSLLYMRCVRFSKRIWGLDFVNNALNFRSKMRGLLCCIDKKNIAAGFSWEESYRCGNSLIWLTKNFTSLFCLYVY